MREKKGNLISRMFGRKKRIDKSVSGKEQQPIATTVMQDTIPDIAQTIAAHPPEDVVDIRAKEKEVPVEWNIGDVILDLYEVKHIHESGGMGLVYRVHHNAWNMDLAVKSPRAELLMKNSRSPDPKSELRNL